jgi:hypothetical protein
MAIGDCGHLRAKWSKSHMSRQPELAVANECFLAGQDDIKANLITPKATSSIKMKDCN